MINKVIDSKIILSIIIVSLVFFNINNIICYEQQEKAEYYIKNGQDNLKDRKFTSAISDFSIAIAVSADTDTVTKVSAYNGLAETYNKIENYKNAKKECLTAISKRYYNKDTYYHLGFANFKLKEYLDASRNFEIALELNLAGQKIRELLGESYLNIGSYKKAMDILKNVGTEKALKLYKEADEECRKKYFNPFLAEIKNKRYSETLALLRNSRIQFPHYIEEIENKIEKVKKDWLEIIEKEIIKRPDSIALRNLLRDLDSKNRKYIDLYYNGRIAYSHENWRRAINCFQDANNYKDARTLLMNSILRKKEIIYARLKHDPGNQGLISEYIDLLRRLGKPTEGIKDYFLGLFYFNKKKDWEQAIYHFDRVPDSFINYEDAKIKQSNAIEKYIPILINRIQYDRLNGNARSSLRKYFINKGLDSKIVPFYFDSVLTFQSDSWQKRKKTKVRLAAFESNAYIDQNTRYRQLVTERENQLVQSVEQDSTDYELRFKLITLYILQEKNDEAISAYEKLVQDNPSYLKQRIDLLDDSEPFHFIKLFSIYVKNEISYLKLENKIKEINRNTKFDLDDRLDAYLLMGLMNSQDRRTHEDAKQQFEKLVKLIIENNIINFDSKYFNEDEYAMGHYLFSRVVIDRCKRHENDKLFKTAENHYKLAKNFGLYNSDMENLWTDIDNFKKQKSNLRIIISSVSFWVIFFGLLLNCLITFTWFYRNKIKIKKAEEERKQLNYLAEFITFLLKEVAQDYGSSDIVQNFLKLKRKDDIINVFNKKNFLVGDLIKKLDNDKKDIVTLKNFKITFESKRADQGIGDIQSAMPISLDLIKSVFLDILLIYQKYNEEKINIKFSYDNIQVSFYFNEYYKFVQEDDLKETSIYKLIVFIIERIHKSKIERENNNLMIYISK